MGKVAEAGQPVAEGEADDVGARGLGLRLVSYERVESAKDRLRDASLDRLALDRRAASRFFGSAY